MKFKNNRESMQIRIVEEGGYRWESVGSGEIIDLPEDIGLANKLEKVEPKEEKPKKEKSKSSKKSK